MNNLDAAPSSLLDPEGRPRMGTYRGYCRDTDLTNFEAEPSLSSPTGGRLLREKCWQWFAVATPEVACGGTLFDATYATTVFLWVFDRDDERMLIDHMELLPPFMAELGDDPASEDVATLRGFDRTFEVERDDEQIDVEVRLAESELRFELDLDGNTPLTSICRPGREGTQGVNFTQKETCLPVEGRIDVEGRVFELGSSAYGMLDYTHGLLPRETHWNWAIAGGELDDGTPIGFNISEGLNGTMENAVWVGDRLCPVDSVQFGFDPDAPDESWNLYSEDGAIDLTLAVEGIRRHETDLSLVSSTYMQPLGRWHGRLIDREAHDLFGVAEHHEARW